MGPPGVSPVAVCAAFVLGLVCVTAVACGKKGPPLAPLLRIPAPVGDFSARRLGATVYLRFVIPTRNQDNATPADVTRVEVYGYTGKPAADDDMVEYGTLVASVPVRPPPREDEDQTRRAQTPPEEPRAADAQQPGFDQGATVTVTETLTPELMQPVVVKPRKQQVPRDFQEPPALLAIASFDDIRSRVYVAVGVNHKGRRGVFSPHAAVPVIALPEPPTGLHVTYTETQILLAWTPPPGAPPPAVAPPVAADTDAGYLRGRPIVPVAAPAWFYDVFEVPGPGAASPHALPPPTAARPEMPRVEPPSPLNQQPVAAAAFADTRIEFGAERCYAVRTVNVFGKLQQESEPSEVACVTPRDTFPPAAPRSLIAVVSDGVISLSWEPNSENDLAGYLVLRADATGAPLEPMIREPIQTTTFEDKTVKPGVRYVYAVVALDKSTPPNISKESNRIEETAR